MESVPGARWRLLLAPEAGGEGRPGQQGRPGTEQALGILGILVPSSSWSGLLCWCGGASAGQRVSIFHSSLHSQSLNHV